MLITLYYGDNDVHEFWESKDKRFLFIRNHGEKVWQALYVGGDFLNEGARSAKGLARRIEKDYDYQFNFNVGQYWLRLYPHHRQMRLMPMPQPSF